MKKICLPPRLVFRAIQYATSRPLYMEIRKISTIGERMKVEDVFFAPWSPMETVRALPVIEADATIEGE